MVALNLQPVVAWGPSQLGASGNGLVCLPCCDGPVNINITSHHVIQEIGKLIINKSLVVDEVFPRVLKECKNTIGVALTDIFDKSITSGDVETGEYYSNF